MSFKHGLNFHRWGDSMAKQYDLKKLVEDNPDVDVDQLKRAVDALRELQSTGVVRQSTYGLETPESAKRLAHQKSRGFVEETPIRILR